MRDRGSATAEWALVLPAVVLVLAAVLSAVAAMVEQSRLDGVAADAARLASLGESARVITAHASRVFGAAVVLEIDSSTMAHTVCVSASRSGTGGALPLRPLAISGKACALDVGNE